MKKRTKHILINLIIIFISIILAIILAETGTLAKILNSIQSTSLASFLSGMFFVSIFTAAPSFVALAELGTVSSALTISFYAGIGGLVGDLIIFRFIKDSLSGDVIYYIRKKWPLFPYRKSVFARFFLPTVGAVIIASPFPDEIGLALMGITKIKTFYFIPISFVLNFLGIFAITSLVS